MLNRRVAIIGAGAAGCFAAACLRDCIVDVYEAAPKPLTKVAVTGGGRCNITNSFALVRSVKEVYPRGYSLMKRALKEFSPSDTLGWFEDAGVGGFAAPDADGCIFPNSQDANEIVRVLLAAMSRSGARLHTGKALVRLHPPVLIV